MLCSNKRQLKSLTDFCDDVKSVSGINFYGNGIETNKRKIAIRVLLKLDGIREKSHYPS